MRRAFSGARGRFTGILVWPKNCTPILLPPRPSEVQPGRADLALSVRQRPLNRVFDIHIEIIDADCGHGE